MEVKISQKTTIKQIFSSLLDDGEIFSIPIYQREYSWREEQWKEFFDDARHSFQKNEIDTDYWGSILVFYNKDNNEYEIVDGQQRIVTILLFILSLGKKYRPDEKLPLKFTESKNDLWIKLAQDKNLTQDEKRSSLAQAKAYFKKNISGNTLDSEKLLNHIYNTQISIVIIDDEIESNLLFGRLNTRGVRLDDVDLIKHKIFYETERNSGPTNNDDALEKWKCIQKAISGFNMTIESFIPLWWETRYDLSEENLYSSFEKELRPCHYLSFLDSLLNTATQIENWRRNDTGSDNKLGRNLNWLLKIASSPKVFSVIIAMADVTFEGKINLLELLTVFEFARAITPPPSIIGKEVVGWSRLGVNYEFSDLDYAYIKFSKKITSTDVTGLEIKEEIKILKNIMLKLLPEKEDFEELFSSLRWADKGDWYRRSEEKLLSTYAIYTLNNWLDTVNHGAGEQYRTKDDDDYSIEHILPKGNATASEESSEYRIGNLTVLEKTINNDLGNRGLLEKLPAYKESNYPQVKELLYKNKRKFALKTRVNRNIEWGIKNFDNNAINFRGNYLADCFFEKIEQLIER
ncbi:DUF262 domain-containing protein [Lactococcus lactis]|uniref:DUF262 domain-containing protein n=1 Tax=Lactococcus lactis TaxID=1358 RepID=UPI0022E2F246|nr:DUF262 domain-containing protein [Lactococcus lactis]